MTLLNGILVQGHQVASRASKDYPYGTLEKQIPFFKSRGLDLNSFFNGTLNIDISPYTFKLIKPEFTFQHVEWTDLHPPEDFSFSRCKVIYENIEYDGWVYYPHPQTKLRHFQNPSLLEVIAIPVPKIKYEDEVQVLVNPDEIEIVIPYNKEME
ncbi:MAG: hypothetical protein H7Y59_03010 [Anaerolineales bacterium]|nr:hypothetical protein [Anaerolineales bacterium]